MNQLVGAVAKLLRQSDEVSGALYQEAALWCAPGDGDATSATKLNKALVPKLPKGPQYRVGVDPKHSREVVSWRQTLTWSHFTFRDRSTDLGCDLLVQRH